MAKGRSSSHLSGVRNRWNWDTPTVILVLSTSLPHHTLAVYMHQRVTVIEKSATRQRHHAVVNSEKAHKFDQEGWRSIAMQPTVSPQQRQAAKREMIEQIEQGASVLQVRNQS